VAILEGRKGVRMPSIKKAIKPPQIAEQRFSAFSQTELWKSEFASRLGIVDLSKRSEVLGYFHRVMSKCSYDLEMAKKGPLLADYIAVMESVREKADALLRELTQLDDVYLEIMPHSDKFLEQLQQFRMHLNFNHVQVRGLPNARGGARQQAIKHAKDATVDAFRTFWDMHAVNDEGVSLTSVMKDMIGQLMKNGVDPKPRSERVYLTDYPELSGFLKSRDEFAVWAATSTDLIPSPSRSRPPAKKSASTKRSRA
jgi:hypothetical protein